MTTFNPIPFAQVGDVGVQLIIQITDQDGNVVDISTASTLTIKIGRPDGTTADRTAALYTTGTDGKLVYTSVSGDFTESGSYSIQAKVTIGSSVKSSKVGTFVVNDNVDNA